MEIKEFFTAQQSKDSDGLAYTTFYSPAISDGGNVKIGNGTFTAYIANGVGDGEVRIRIYSVTLKQFNQYFWRSDKWEHSGMYKGSFSVYSYDYEKEEAICTIDTKDNLIDAFYCTVSNSPIIAFVEIITTVD